ncbi:MAG: DegT/DnrJ/EryC1/StrS family aminotransferase [Bacteroidales bacterium]|nr:DegT/DnrJ/EryC1/StrS family aminotransferase [Bacteroidales bacterium]
MIPFSPPRIDDKIIAEVIDTLKSGWITTGPKTKLFEKRLNEYCGAKSTVAVNSATAGLELVLRWFGVKEGDEVIVPAYTYCATANVVIHCGARPVMVDINANDFCISIENIKQAVTERTKVIIPVDIAGLPCDYDAINQLVMDPTIKAKFTPQSPEQERLGRILVLSDAAHSIGAWYKQRRTGILTDISVFSFHAVKNLTTAEGGAIVMNLPETFNHEELYRYFCTYMLHGQTKDALAKMQKGSWRYDIIDAGYKANMTDILASIGLVELQRYDTDTLVKRKHIFDIYQNAFSNCSWADLPIYEDKDRISSYHVYLLRIKGINEMQRDAIIQHIFDKDVSVNVHFQPLPLLTAYKKRGYRIADFPVAWDNYQREISLPVFYDLTDEMLATVIDAVKKSVEEVLNL